MGRTNREAFVRLLSAGGSLHVVGYKIGNQSAFHVRFRDTDPDATVGIFGSPGSQASPSAANIGVEYGSDPFSSLGGGVAATLDGNGFPIAAFGLGHSGLVLVPSDQVILVRPADALDQDGDGAPRLWENAFMMNPFRADVTLVPKPRIRAIDVPGIGTRLSFDFRHRFPLVPGSAAPWATGRYGEFLYSVTTSLDLTAFARVPPGASDPFPSRTILASPATGIGEQYLGVTVDPPYLSTHLETFVRLEVERER
jgi:hypothetical protein